jgi:cytochrome c2
MPQPRGSALVPLAAVLILRLIGMGCGLRGQASSGRSRTAPFKAFDPQAHMAGILLPAPSRIRRGSVLISLALVALAAAGIYAAYQIKFVREARARAIALTAGDPDLGRDLTQRYGCAGCHTIPGIPRAQGKVGPTLQGFAARAYIGGVATNSPNTLIQWIENPRSIDPKTAMPATGISRAEARHVAAYLYTLR